jgi:hypothetical protein
VVGLTDREVRTGAEICQWGMTLYAANPMTVISPPVIIVLCTVSFLFNIADIVMDAVAHGRRL